MIEINIPSVLSQKYGFSYRQTFCRFSKMKVEQRGNQISVNAIYAGREYTACGVSTSHAFDDLKQQIASSLKVNDPFHKHDWVVVHAAIEQFKANKF